MAPPSIRPPSVVPNLRMAASPIILPPSQVVPLTAAPPAPADAQVRGSKAKPVTVPAIPATLWPCFSKRCSASSRASQSPVVPACALAAACINVPIALPAATLRMKYSAASLGAFLATASSYIRRSLCSRAISVAACCNCCSVACG